MTKKANLSTLQETLAAQAFLRTISADWHDNNLILAIVAWLREQEKANPGYGKYNNVFQLLALPGHKSFQGTVNNSGRPRNLAVFRNLQEEMVGLAKFLLSSKDPSFRLMITAARAKGGAGYAATQFLTALQASGFDQGVTVPYPGKQGYVEDAVWAIYSTFTGVTLPTVKTKTTTTRAFPTAPAALQPPGQEDDYLKPYAAQEFFAARHPAARTGRAGR